MPDNISSLSRPTDDRFLRLLEGMQSDLDKLKSTPQPFRGDWVPVNDALEFVSASSMQFVDDTIVASNFMVLSDKIRWKQTGDTEFRYAYVTDLTANVITLTGGDDFDVANSTIIEFARGITVNPIGFPTSFNFTPVPRDYNDSVDPTAITTNTCKFIYDHPFITVFQGNFTGTFSFPVIGVTLTLPVNGGETNNKFLTGNQSPIFFGAPAQTIDRSAEALFGDLSKVRVRDIPPNAQSSLFLDYAFIYYIS